MKQLLVIIISLMLIIGASPSAFADEAPEISESAVSDSNVIEASVTSESFASESAVSEASESSEVNIESSDNYAPTEVASSYYTAYIKKDSAGKWFAWTWGQREGKWVSGWETDCYYETVYETYYGFEFLDRNVVFVCFDNNTAKPSWDDGSVIKQTVDIQLDGINNEFVVSGENSEGKCTGYLTIFDESKWSFPSDTMASEAATSEAAIPWWPVQSEQNCSEAPDPTKPTKPTDPSPSESDKNTDPTKKPSDDKPSASEASIKENESGKNADSVSPRLNLRTATVKCGKVISLKVLYRDGKKVKYTSSNKKVAKVNSKGKVSALKKGIARITAKVGSKKLYFTIKVTSSPKLSKKSVTIRKGKSKIVKAVGKCGNVKNTYNNTKKAKIISKRTAAKLKIKGLRKGKTTLRIRVNGKLLKLKVKVI